MPNVLYDSAYGKTLVSQEFNQMCTEAKVEAKVQAFPNPGDPMRAMRLITFKNYALEEATVIQQNKRKKKQFIPAAIVGYSGAKEIFPGELQVMVAADEPLPIVMKGKQ